jgi:hypothetical protein
MNMITTTHLQLHQTLRIYKASYPPIQKAFMGHTLLSLYCPLLQMTFKRPATDRQLTFEEISRETRLPLNEVELLVMKALAQGLVRGAIDQVACNVHMTWVQPRVLDKQQV